MTGIDGSRGDALERLGFSSLNYAPFRIFFSANLLSNASWFIFSAALGTYVLQLTGSAAQVGFVSFIYSLPGAIFMLHAGLLTDRFGAKRLVAISLGAGGVAVCGLGLLTLERSPLWTILVLSFAMGAIQTLGAPGFIAIVNDLVPTRAISSAVALIFLGFNVGRITGGIGAGILIAILSPDKSIAAALSLFVAGILQAAPSIPIWRIRVSETVSRPSGIALVRPLVEAGAYALRYPTLGVILVLAAAPGAIGLAYMYVLPVTVRDLGADPDAIGLLFAGAGVGGLAAGLIAEPLMRSLGQGRAIFLGLAAAAAGLIGVGASGLLTAAVFAIGVAQAGFVIYAAASLALVQALAPSRLRGRLNSLFTLLFWGLMPFGALLLGEIAERTDALIALEVAGLVIIAAGIGTLVGRRQIVSLKIDRDGSSVRGDLRGSGSGSQVQSAAGQDERRGG